LRHSQHVLVDIAHKNRHLREPLQDGFGERACAAAQVDDPSARRNLRGGQQIELQFAALVIVRDVGADDAVVLRRIEAQMGRYGSVRRPCRSQIKF